MQRACWASVASRSSGCRSFTNRSRVGPPLLGRVPAQAHDLRARVDVARLLVHLVDVGDQRQVLDQGAEAPVGLVQRQREPLGAADDREQAQHDDHRQERSADEHRQRGVARHDPLEHEHRWRGEAGEREQEHGAPRDGRAGGRRLLAGSPGRQERGSAEGDREQQPAEVVGRAGDVLPRQREPVPGDVGGQVAAHAAGDHVQAAVATAPQVAAHQQAEDGGVDQGVGDLGGPAERGHRRGGEVRADEGRPGDERDGAGDEQRVEQHLPAAGPGPEEQRERDEHDGVADQEDQVADRARLRGVPALHDVPLPEDPAAGPEPLGGRPAAPRAGAARQGGGSRRRPGRPRRRP